MGAAKQADGSAVETPFEGEDAEVGRARGLVLQDGGELLLGEAGPAASLVVHVAHEDHLDT